MDSKQLDCFQYCYTKGVDSADPMFIAWKKMKLETNFTAPISADPVIDTSHTTFHLEDNAATSHATVHPEDNATTLHATVHTVVHTEDNATKSLVDEGASALNQSISIPPSTFPFQNSSYPGDEDTDILQYPASIVKKDKRTKPSNKFFVLTSKEEYESKVKQAQDKINGMRGNRKNSKIRQEKAALKIKANGTRKGLKNFAG